MKKNNNQTLEVLEPEVEEIPLEQVIDQTLVKHNVTNAVIASLKEKYGGMQLRSLDDKENYIEIKEARKEVRKVGILTEKLCKKGREDAIAIQKKWLQKEKEILGKISEVEDPLNTEIERFENEVERKELAEKKRQEEIYINRQTALSRMGAVYDNGSYVLNHISYEIELIKQADDDLWNDTIYPKYKKVYEENQATLVEEENKRKAEMEEQKKQRDAFELQQADFKLQQQMFANQQADLRKQMEDAEREKRLVQERLDAEAKQKHQQVIDNRINDLRGLGMTFNHVYNTYSFEDITVDVEQQVNIFGDENWIGLIEKITPVISSKKAVAEQRKIEEQEKQKQEAIQKALEAEKIKQEQEKQQKEIEMAQANDKGKYADVVSYLKQVPKHEMKSSLYKSKMRIINDFIQDI